MYAALHSATTVLFVLQKLRNFIVSRGYHHSVKPGPVIGTRSKSEAICNSQQPSLLLTGDDSMNMDHDVHSTSPSQKAGNKALQTIVSSIKNTCLCLHNPSDARALLRFVLFELLPKLILNVARYIS